MAKSFSDINVNKKSFKDPNQKRWWQGSIGLVVFVLFVLSSVVVNRTVQALNLASGNYGYYGGTYGFNSGTTSSDYPPSPATSLSTSVTTSSITFSWTAPTTTTGSTSLDNLSGYCYQTGSSSVTTCTLSDSTTTSTSLTISSLGCSATRYIAVRAYDGNNNLSDALAGSATTSSCGGGGGGGGGTVTGPTYPTGPVEGVTTTTPTTGEVVTAPSTLADAVALTTTLGVTRNLGAEQTASTQVSNSVEEFGVTLTATQTQMATNFVAYGYSTATQKLGSGERLALVRDAFDTLQRFPNDPANFFEQLATSRKPMERNLPREVARLRTVLPAFEALMGRRPNFKVVEEDLGWNTLMYRIRFTRDLNKERAGITKFRSIYRRDPTSPFDWSIVKAWGYMLVNVTR